MCFVSQLNIKQQQAVPPAQLVVGKFTTVFSMSLKRKKISYPLVVEKSVCELTGTRGAVSISVEEVQQQIDGNDRGLLAIAYCAALCQNLNPCSLDFNQFMMR